MIIERLQARNFRSLRDVDLDCDDLTAILGKNSSGKSSILHALDVFYDVGAKLSREDFYAHDVERDIVLRVTFGRLTADERSEFYSFLYAGRLTVTKRMSFQSSQVTQQYFATVMQIPDFAEIRRVPQKSERLKAYRELASSGMYEGLPTSARSAATVEQQMSAFEESHEELLEPCEKPEQFLGPKNIGGGKLDKYTAFVLVPAVHDAVSETGRTGAISELIDLLVTRRVYARSDVKRLRKDFDERAKEVFSKDNLTELTELSQTLSETLGQYSPGAALDLSWDDAEVPEIKLPPAIAKLVEDEFAAPITHTGHGLQRALVLTLLQELAVVQRSEDRYQEQVEEDGSLSEVDEREPTPGLILAIEEPELYLHPLRCRYLAHLFRRLTQERPESEPQNQIFYATHSPYFVDLDRFDQVRLARRTSELDEPAPCFKVTHFKLKEAAKELERVAAIKGGGFTRDSFRARSGNVMTTMVNEGFFASAVLVVEGFGDAAVFHKLQEVMGHGWDGRGVAVVPAAGKNNIDKPVVIFRGLGLPTYFIFDGDANGKDRESSRRNNKRLLRLARAEVQGFPKTQIHNEWAVLEDKLETELELALGKDMFLDIRGTVAEELGYTDSATVLKSGEGAAFFVELVYERGLRVRVLEEVVEAVTQLL